LSGGTRDIALSLAPGVGLHGLIALGLWSWSRWLARGPKTLPWRHAPWLPVLGLALALLGITLSTLELDAAFEAVSAAEPANKASQLAEHVSGAMRAAWLAIPVWLLYLASLVLCLVGSWQARRRAR
jgi:hypothetical protein